MENKKTDPDKLDDKSFPILDDLAEQEDVNLKVEHTVYNTPSAAFDFCGIGVQPCQHFRTSMDRPGLVTNPAK